MKLVYLGDIIDFILRDEYPATACALFGTVPLSIADPANWLEWSS